MRCYLFLNQKVYTDEEIADLMLLNVGPSHPASHGTIRNFVALEGETIAACVTEIGYLHRGFEKACRAPHLLSSNSIYR